MKRDGAPLVVGGAVAMAGLGLAALAVEHALAHHLRADELDLVEAGLVMPDDVDRHEVVVSDGGAISVVEAGRGPCVVLVHGVTLSSEIYAPVLGHLRRSMRVLAVDLRGHGHSSVGSDGVSFDRQARDLAEVFEALDVTDAVLVGHSMGGMISQVLLSTWTERVRERVRHFVALDTSAGPLGTSRSQRRLAAGLGIATTGALRWTESRGNAMLPGSDLATWVARSSFGSHPSAVAVEQARILTTSMPPGLMADLTHPLLGFDGRAALGRIETPTTVMVGRRDLLTPPRMARELADGIPGAELMIVEGAGHMIMLEAPEVLVDVIDAHAAGMTT